MALRINSDTSIDEILQIIPQSADYLKEQGVKCLHCGKPVKGTLEKAAKKKGFGNSDIEKFVNDINSMIK